jgi:hypothetical protein
MDVTTFIKKVCEDDQIRNVKFSYEEKKGCHKLSFANKLFIYFFYHIEHSEHLLPYMYIRFFDYHGDANSVGLYLDDMNEGIEEKAKLCIRSVITLVTSQDPTKREYARFWVNHFRNDNYKGFTLNVLVLFIVICLMSVMMVIYLQ